MTIDPFTEAARAEALRAWVKESDRMDSIGTLGAHMAEWARDHLAAQEPTDTALFELLWEAVAEVRDAHPRVHDDAPTDDVVAAVLPIIRAENALVWDVAYGTGVHDADIAADYPARANPYREYLS